jgi:photosystem II stability/assembly factor-like uncharacterized protein
LASSNIYSLVITSTGSIFAGTNSGVYISIDSGSNWTQVGLAGSYVFSLAINSTGYIFAGTDGGGIYRSTNNGSSWLQVGSTNSNDNFLAITSTGYIFVGTQSGGIYRSTDIGNSWTQVNTGLTNNYVHSIAIDSSGDIFAGTDSGGVYQSTNNGNNWAQFSTGLTNSSVYSLAINSSSCIFAGTWGAGVFRSTNPVAAPSFPALAGPANGSTEVSINSSLKWNASAGATSYRLQVSTDSTFVTTTYDTSGLNTTSMTISGLSYEVKYFWRVNATDSAGTSGWSNVWNFTTVQETLKRGDVDGNINGGPDAYSASLVLKYLADLDTLNAQQLTAAEVDGNAEIEADDAYWILYATAYGTFPDGSLPKTNGIQAGNIAIGKLSSEENSNLITIPVILQKSQGIHACYVELNIDGRYTDVDSVVGNLPKGWLIVHNYVKGVLKIAMAGITPLTDGTLATINLNLKNKSVKFSVSGSAKLNANLNSQINSFTVQAVPGQFGLSQNYPNPFNPSTVIQYQLAQDSHVGLTIYDILGQKIKTLVSGMQQAGYYNITWDGTNNSGNKVASGIYIYRLQAGNFTKTLKMNLLK